MDWNDQAGINKCLIFSKTLVKWTVLPTDLFPTGFRLRKKELDKSMAETLSKNHTRTNSHARMPYILHFNWIAGNIKKKRAMKRYNVWCPGSENAKLTGSKW